MVVEIEGGIWQGQGSHGRGSGIRRDIDKGNASVVEGWAVLRCSSDMLREDGAGFVELVATVARQRYAEIRGAAD